MIPVRQNVARFDPRTIPTCTLWLDAADSNTITVTSGNVSVWRDKSSNAITFSNGALTGRRGPTRVATQNGLDVLTFTATSATDVNGQYLNNPSPAFSFFPQSFCLFLVHKPDLTTGASYGNMNAFCFSTGTNGMSLPFSDATGNRGARINNSVWNYQPVTTDYNLIAFCSRRYAGAMTTHNGTDISFTASSGFTNTAPTPYQTTVVGAFRSGPTTFINFYSGTIAEIICYSGLLRRNEQQQVEGYLAWKWGLASNLPSTHPFKHGPPIVRPLRPIDIADCILWFDAADARTLTTSGTQVTRWQNKGILSNAFASNSVAAPLTAAPGTISTGYTFNTSSLNALQFPAASYLAVSNVTFSNQMRTLFYIFTVTSYGDGYSSVLTSSTRSGSNVFHFNAWNRDGNTIIMYPNALSGEELVVAGGQAPYSGTLPYNATPFVIGIRHTQPSNVASSNYNQYAVSNAISINGRSVTLATNLPLRYGYRVGADTMVLGSTAYSNVQRIGEVVYYDRALSDSEMRQVEGYLCQKWNVVADASHAYVRVPPMVPLFNMPNMLPGCILWLDAADPTTLVTSGSSVTTWNDKSPRAFNVSFSVGPTTGTQTQNGNNVLVFSGSRGSNLNCVISSDTHTLIAVHRPSDVASNTSLFRFQTGTASPYVVFPYYATSNRGYVTSANGATLSNTGAGLPDASPTSSYTLLGASISNSNLQVFSNGALVASSTSALTVGLLPGLTIGATTTGTEPYGGNVAELLVFNAQLSTGQRQILEGYLAKKWNI